MHYFWRSLKYLKPYRVRLAIACACVPLIALLWGGGIGMVVPVSDTLMSKHGMHAEAWSAMIQSRIGAEVALKKILVRRPGDPDLPSMVISVDNVKNDTVAANAGLSQDNWIIGKIDEGKELIVEGRDLARQLAKDEFPAGITLLIFNPFTGVQNQVHIIPNKVGLDSLLLGKITGLIPESASNDLPGRFPTFMWIIGLVIILTIARDLLRFIQEYLVMTAVYRGAMDLRCDNYDTVLRLPMTYFSAKGTSDTMSRFIQDTNVLVRGQVTLFGKTLVEPAKAIGSLGMALFFSWKLTLLALVAGPPAYLLIRLLGKAMKRASKKALQSWSSMLGVLEETLVGVRVVKAYTMESSERKRFMKVNSQLFKQQRRMSRINAATAPAIEAMGIIAGMAAVAIAGHMVLNEGMGTSRFVGLMGALVAMFDPVRKLAKVSMRFQESDAAAARIFELRDQEIEKSPAGAPQLARHNKTIEFRDVCFRYPNTNSDVLVDINLKVEFGETVAIVGPNGCGKTTLVSLLPRLLDCREGSVLIDGQDISQVSIRSLRRQIGLVTQDSVLFNATIAENISYGKRRPTEQEILDASKKAFVDEFVSQMPDGYETMVGEHGATLSGGQKQRISIARAIVRNPTILIFDEAMSQVDSDSEHRIYQAMEKFRKGRTTLLIAHRFATVLSADRIVVMNDGRIDDIGTHEQLLQRCQLYQHLYRTQFVDSQ